jgi:beta-glucosidase
MKRQYILALLTLLLFSNRGNSQVNYPFQDPDMDMEKRVDNIISMMTLDEKIGYVVSSSVDRLGIPSPGRSEGIHQAVVRSFTGGGQAVPTTSFCQVYGMGSTWDPALIQQAGSVVGYEGRYLTQSDKYRRPTLVLWGPTSDLARDPRWGRNDESFSEDAFFTGTMVTAYIQGLQGNDPTYWQSASLLKHVFANSNETTRGRSSSDFDDRLMREYYSKPFMMGFTLGGAHSYMAAYNAWNGVPMTVNPVLKEVVGKEWGADWIVSSDAMAVGAVVTGHRYLETVEEAFAASLKLGMNQYLERNVDSLLRVALDKEMISEKDFDAAIRGKLRTTIKLGLLDPPDANPYASIGSGDEPEPWNSEKHRSVALQVAQESVVMLKNNDHALPLDQNKVTSIAVIGPGAANVLFDFYSGSTPYAISVLDGIRNKVGDAVQVNYAADNDYNAAVDAAGSSDVAIVVIGNDPMCGADPSNMGALFNQDLSTKPCSECGEGREGRDRQSLDLPSEDLVKEVLAVNPNTIVVLISSFPYAINWSQEHVPAILHITHAAQEQGTAIANVLFGDYNPAGRLVQTWPKGLDQLPYMLDYNIRHGRTYMYFREEPLYAFGYGLSYSGFEYSNMRLSRQKAGRGERITISTDILNTGEEDGEEVVQLYVQYPGSEVPRPLKELKGFKRVHIKAGETKTVEIVLDLDELSYWNSSKGSYELEKGTVNLLIGASSADIRLKTPLTVL